MSLCFRSGVFASSYASWERMPFAATCQEFIKKIIEEVRFRALWQEVRQDLIEYIVQSNIEAATCEDLKEALEDLCYPFVVEYRFHVRAA